MSILEAKNVSIRYITGDFKDIGLKEYLIRRLQGNYRVNEFWADRNVSFRLKKGEMLGIIGSNGAGKSTLLKAVAGIMEPTCGQIKRKGTIAALLELASGFDGDLTVRENTYLRGALIGYSRQFIDEMYDQIINFAELQEFEDRPFKQLSSGMKSRLAFSIACMVKPDILILDEVLSVGDSGFRKKSEAKMREIINSGTTTILVSHSLSMVREMCDKVLWLHRGEQIAFGDQVDTICDAYSAMMNLNLGSRDLILKPGVASENGEPTVRFLSHPADLHLTLGEQATFSVEVEGDGQFFYQWECYDESYKRWHSNFRSDCSGVHSPVLTVPATALRNGAIYRCAILGIYENYYSNEAHLTIDQPASIEIIKQPQSITASVGEMAVFTVETNLKGLSYQWQFSPRSSSVWYIVSSQSCKGFRSPMFSVPAEMIRNGNRYRCRIIGIGEEKITQAATLSVLD